MTKQIRGALLAATMLTGAPALAQETPASPPGAVEEDSEDGNEIVITARKREESLQEVPTTVSVATAETIDRLALDNLTDIARITPGLAFDDSFGRDSNRPVIRGQASILGESGVAFFIDGIYYSGTLADYDVDTIERIEVVKGPQSALYGRNTYSGAINIVSKLPTDRWEGRVTADLSEHDRYEVTAGVRGPLTEGLSAGINGRFYDFGGEFTNQFDGTKIGEQSSWSVSGLLRWDDGGPLTAQLRGYYNRTDDGQPAIFAQSANANNCLFDNGSLYRGQGRYFCGVIRPQPVSTDYSLQFPDEENVGLEADTYNVSLRLDYALTDELSLTSLTGYNNREQTLLTDGDYSPFRFQFPIVAFPRLGPPGAPLYGVIGFTSDFSFANLSKAEDWSQELRLTYESDAVDIIVGGYYFDQSSDGFTIRTVPTDAQAVAIANANAARAARCAATPGCRVTVPLFPGAITTATPNMRDENLTDTRNIAAFGAVTWHVTDTFNIGVEGRYAEERIRQAAFGFDEGEPRPTPILSSTTFKEFTPRVTADWRITPDNLLYAVYAEGQKPGGFNGVTAIDAGVPTFEPEDATAYEIGLKNSFLDNALIANVALFRNEIDGYQLTQNISVPPNQVSVITNAGEARIDGLELELVMRPDDRFTVTANYALADSRFTSGFDENQGVLNDVADDGLVNCSTGDEFPDVTGCQSAFGSIVGKRIPRAPVHSVFADLDYRAPIGAGDWELFAGANVKLTSSSFAQVHNLAETGDAVVVDARIGAQNDRFKVHFYVDNLTDEDAVQQIIRYADANNDLRRNFIAGLRPGRRFGVILSAGF